MENIFFDLDGTLLESRPRLYKLFQQMVPLSGLSFDEYWALKRNKTAHKEILRDLFNYQPMEITRFEADWLKQIEQPEWLILDEPFAGISDYLKALKQTHKVFIVTSRQSEKMAFEQISRFGWLEMIDKLLVTGQVQEKYDLIKNEVKVSSGDWLVGDTGKDIQTGKRLGMNTAAVLTGFLNREKLAEYEPDIIETEATRLNFNQLNKLRTT
ncbi:HAD family hydrolase [Mucilaginibacter sp. BT774]|uniref:HAD family hydrolase n=1 Tax=Mucilaginibacter sp. BT774 TaxID=3062276 RepID=UPI002676D8C8|nr:HAD hydrolase-like protein [Mucilaginibacter sp. BT774]MDO3625927.1 HAD hydrolase-like protein [Mucilaginibacter sp. BT774]